MAVEDVPAVSTVYKVLRALEDAGRARRGYFIEGLGAAQFTQPERLTRCAASTDGPRRPQGRAPGPRPRGHGTPRTRTARRWTGRRRAAL
ncbi:hypothetical protein QJS66_17220 [Kocuria rhizophila]|nr:hypothetical protein QJS66_17220 [Kocuria rhizophila]